MKKHLIVLTLCGVLTGSVMLAEVKAQEQKHEEHQAGKTVSNKNAAEPAKTDGMKCCEGMEKMGDKGVKTQTQESKDEKSQPTKDAHQH